MSDSDNDLDGFVPLRPHSAGPLIQPRSRGPARPGGQPSGATPGASSSAGGGPSSQPVARKPLRPKPPTEQRRVEKSSLTSASKEESASAILQNALRRSEALHSSGVAVPFIPEAFQGMSAKKFGITDNLGLSSNAQSFVGAQGSAPPPRRAKDRGAGKSLELADLAFTPFRRGRDGITRESYAPISLPYYNFAQEDEGADRGQSARPTLHHIDERNSNAARELFLTDDGTLLEDKFLLMQLPAVLPELLDPTEEFVRADDADTNGPASGETLPPTLSRLPDGKIGKLKIHKSGKVRMEIAGLPFCVDQGSAIFFQQELGCVCPLAKEFVNLGAVQNRVVLTPDIAALLQQLEEDKAAAAAEAQAASASA